MQTPANEEAKRVKIGIIVPHGWTGKYDGSEPRRAWGRTVEVPRQAERLGFESVSLELEQDHRSMR